MDDAVLDDLLGRAADAVVEALAGAADWQETGEVPGQHASDLVADAAALSVLDGAPVGVLSEESGLHEPEREVVVVVDPLDGSTNASRGVPWYACSLCAVDADGPRVGLVVDLVRGTRYAAIRGAGATRDGEPIHVSGADAAQDSIVVLNGWPSEYLGWKQFRVFGAAALDLCTVADGTVDAFVDCSPAGLAPWDYAAGWLICIEAGGAVAERDGRDLLTRDPTERRLVIAGATPDLVEELRKRRAALAW